MGRKLPIVGRYCLYHGHFVLFKKGVAQYGFLWLWSWQIFSMQILVIVFCKLGKFCTKCKFLLWKYQLVIVTFSENGTRIYLLTLIWKFGISGSPWNQFSNEVCTHFILLRFYWYCLRNKDFKYLYQKKKPVILSKIQKETIRMLILLEILKIHIRKWEDLEKRKRNA